jgi:SSS family solute:Na+ symporter
MASSSGLIHAACFLLIGLKLWAIGKRHGYVTQIQFFRARFDSNGLGYLLFPILVLLVIPYLLIGVIGAAKTIGGVTGPKKTPKGMIEGTFPDLFESTGGAIPPWLTGAVICIVVLCYIFAGGSRAAAWANTFQTLVFMTMGVLAFILISNKLGGLGAAIEQAKEGHLVRTVSSEGKVGVPPIMFATYMFIPLSVGMFPHLFQHWLTAKSAKAFKLTVIAHPICIMIVWVPCVLIGLWATGLKPLEGAAPAAVLAKMVGILVKDPVIVGLVTAGILAAIMSSLDSQFLCLGTIFTNDIVLHNTKKKYTDKQILLMARGFVLVIVVITYVLAMVLINQNVFDLAVWCFSGFAALTPLVIAALYWRRATKEGAIASVTATTVVWFYFFAKSGFGGEYVILGGVMPVAICWLTGAVAMVAVSLATKSPSKETVDKFFP